MPDDSTHHRCQKTRRPWPKCCRSCRCRMTTPRQYACVFSQELADRLNEVQAANPQQFRVSPVGSDRRPLHDPWCDLVRGAKRSVCRRLCNAGPWPI
jgi:hypothetical protein